MRTGFSPFYKPGYFYIIRLMFNSRGMMVHWQKQMGYEFYSLCRHVLRKLLPSNERLDHGTRKAVTCPKCRRLLRNHPIRHRIALPDDMPLPSYALLGSGPMPL